MIHRFSCYFEPTKSQITKDILFIEGNKHFSNQYDTNEDVSLPLDEHVIMTCFFGTNNRFLIILPIFPGFS